MDLARQSLSAFLGKGEPRITFEGPDVSLSANRALLLTMVLHELGTNAVKYGALSNERGHVEVRWRMTPDEQAKIALEWREVGGPRVTAPERRGFGSRMIAAALHGSEGRADFDYREEGLGVTLEMVL